MSISNNIAVIQERIDAAARRARRNPQEITLMAVTKTHPPERIREAYGAGVRVFGENRVQEFAGKTSSLGDLTCVDWHMIGHLQTNKAVKAIELFTAVDSVDSVRLAEKLNSAAQAQEKKVPVLIEINIAGEQAKTGLSHESHEIEDLLHSAPRFDALTFQGLMTVPPFTEDPQAARPYFRKLREIGESLRKRKLPAIGVNVLSMGMSHDFEVAIEEGATCVRLGTVIFGERPKVT
jgi:pyridoxal phosphate enzyme (YggS family)